MSGVYRAPIGVRGPWNDANGKPLAGYKLYQCLAGTAGVATLQATFTDNTGGTGNANPLTLDVTGGLPNVDMWFSGGVAYKLVLQDPAGATVWSVDNLVGVDDPAFASPNTGEWITGPAGTWISSAAAALGTVFSCNGDLRSEEHTSELQ